MKTIELNFIEMAAVLADITGTNPIYQKQLIDSDGKIGGLLNEKVITQGAKLDLRFVIKNISEKYNVINESRLAMIEEAKGEKDALDPESEESKVFLKEFAEIAKQKHAIDISPANILESNVRAIQSEFDYSEIIELLFE